MIDGCVFASLVLGEWLITAGVWYTAIATGFVDGSKCLGNEALSNAQYAMFYELFSILETVVVV